MAHCCAQSLVAAQVSGVEEVGLHSAFHSSQTQNTDPSRSYCDQLIAERTAIPFKASWKGLEPAQSPTESGGVVHRKESNFSESILPAIWNANRFQKPVQ